MSHLDLSMKTSEKQQIHSANNVVRPGNSNAGLPPYLFSAFSQHDSYLYNDAIVKNTQVTPSFYMPIIPINNSNTMQPNPSHMGDQLYYDVPTSTVSMSLSSSIQELPRSSILETFLDQVWDKLTSTNRTSPKHLSARDIILFHCLYALASEREGRRINATKFVENPMLYVTVDSDKAQKILEEAKDPKVRNYYIRGNLKTWRNNGVLDGIINELQYYAVGTDLNLLNINKYGFAPDNKDNK